MDELTGVGDLDRDGFTDLLARHRGTGDLYFYPGRGLGFAPAGADRHAAGAACGT